VTNRLVKLSARKARVIYYAMKIACNFGTRHFPASVVAVIQSWTFALCAAMLKFCVMFNVMLGQPLFLEN
jgi:hypothetical protein